MLNSIEDVFKEINRLKAMRDNIDDQIRELQREHFGIADGDMMSVEAAIKMVDAILNKRLEKELGNEP